MFFCSVVDLDLSLLRVSKLIVPLKSKCVVVVSIVRITLPVARETHHVCGFFKTAVANQFGVQSSFDALVHELQKLSVKQRTDAVFNGASIDRNRCALCGLRCCEVRLRNNDSQE